MNWQNSSEFCLTCGKEERIVDINTGRHLRFYGDWNCCHCPRSFSLANIGMHVAKELPMKTYEAKGQILLQAHDEADGKSEITGYISFNLPAESFEKAYESATDVADGYEIFSLIELETNE